MTSANTLENNTLKQKSQRNSLMEFYRFLFAMWVVWYHGFFIFKNQYFNHGYMAVEFFFILSGFYILNTIDRYKDKPFFSGLGRMLWGKVKSLGLPFIIGLVFVIWFMFLEGQIGLFGYLWYIPFMFLSFAVIYVLKRLLKSNMVFIISLLSIVIISYLLLYMPILEGWGLFRGLGGVSLGVLISLIPKINLKTKILNFNWIITIALFLLIFYLAFLPKENLISEYFLVLLLFPMLIYFTNTLNVNCRFLNFLGSLSFGLYAYQCVLRVLEFYQLLAQYWLFLILISLVLIDKLLLELFKHYKKEKSYCEKSNTSHQT